MKNYPITSKWVQDNFNIDDERQILRELDYSGDLISLIEEDVGNGVSVDEFIEIIKSTLKGHDFVSFNEIRYSGTTLDLSKWVSATETDNQVVDRLKVEERAKRKIIKQEEQDRVDYERLKLKFEPQSITKANLNLLECSQCRLGKNYLNICGLNHPEFTECLDYVNNHEDL